MVATKELFARLQRHPPEEGVDDDDLLKEHKEEKMTAARALRVQDCENGRSAPDQKKHRLSSADDERSVQQDSISSCFSTSSPRPQASLSAAVSIYSSHQLPVGCLDEYDGCDEVELRARARRCQEIIKLSEQAKEKSEKFATVEAAAAKKAAVAANNVRPLVWNNPNPTLASSAAAAAFSAANTTPSDSAATMTTATEAALSSLVGLATLATVLAPPPPMITPANTRAGLASLASLATLATSVAQTNNTATTLGKRKERQEEVNYAQLPLSSTITTTATWPHSSNQYYDPASWCRTISHPTTGNIAIVTPEEIQQIVAFLQAGGDRRRCVSDQDSEEDSTLYTTV